MSKDFIGRLRCSTVRRFISFKSDWSRTPILLLIAIGCLIFGNFPDRVSAVELMEVNLDDPAIKAFQQNLQSLSVTEQNVEVRGLRVPVLDLVKRPELVPFNLDKKSRLVGPLSIAGVFHPVSTSIDERDKLWYSVTREYQKGVTVTVSADLRVQATADSQITKRPTKNNETEIITSPVKQSEGPASAQINLYRFPNIPYVVDVECDFAQRRLCQSRTFLAAIADKLRLVAIPTER